MKKIIFIAFFFSLTVATVNAEEREKLLLSDLLGVEQLAITSDKNILAVTCRLDRSLLILEALSLKELRKVKLPAPPSGVAITPDGKSAWVTCEAPRSPVCEVELATGKIKRQLTAGHWANAPVVTPDGKTLYVCNRFNNDVTVFDLTTGKELRRIPVKREPVAAAITPDGKTLIVCNLQSTDASDLLDVAADVSLIDTATSELTNIRLLNGSTSIRGVCLSPDGKYAYATHLLNRYRIPTAQLERGWVSTNAFAIIDLEKKKLDTSVLLDDVDLGAANPRGIACSDDGKKLVVSQAGTHELSVIDRNVLHKKLDPLPNKPADQTSALTTDYKEGVPNNLSFLTGMRERIRLEGKGPRNLVIRNDKAIVTEHFSDTIAKVALTPQKLRVETSYLIQQINSDYSNLPSARLGEMYFNDAELCFQRWVSCATCHPDGRAQALNWDLLNDGIGNPKNSRSMLHVVETPPCNITGVRENARLTIEKSIRHLQFTGRDDAIEPIHEYCRQLKAVPSPYLTPEGKLSKLAQDGKKVFEKAKCGRCHIPEKYFQDGKLHNVKSRGVLAKKGEFNTPTLNEVWRSAPYGHDGHYTTIKEWLGDPIQKQKPQHLGYAPSVTKPDPRGRHGQKGKNGEVTLTNKEIDALVEYVLSL